jgi:transketolase
LLALTRQGLPPVSPENVKNHPAEKGAYVLADAEKPDVILVATGSEVAVALEAKKLLDAKRLRTRVVSMPSWFLFENQTEEYRRQVLPKHIPTVSIEAATTFGWARYADIHVGIDRFGLSAPGDQVLREFGFTPEHVAQVAEEYANP